MDKIQLPITNEYGYYEIRLESIGGLGANLCGKMLGEIGMEDLGLNSASFSSYGSEKTGTPVKGYIRYCDSRQEIRVHSPVIHPHLLVIFHEALLENPDVRKGVDGNSKLLVNTSLSPGEASEKYQIPLKNLFCVPGQEIAMKCESRINVIMLGGIGRVSGFLPLESIEKICEKTLGKKYPYALKNNLEGIRHGYQRVVWEEDAGDFFVESVEKQREKISGGGSLMTMGGVNPYFGNSVVNDLSPSRQGYVPVFIEERCIHCALCDMTCPDMVFQFEKGVYKGKERMMNRGLDYYHCKGCMRCVTICPTKALVSEKEEKVKNKPYFKVNHDLIKKPDDYEESGPDGYITSESFLTEERIGGGEI